MKYTDDKIQQQIEAYLNQDMTDLERSGFEKLVHDDDELHDEVELQEATIEAIRHERFIALKSGLSQVNISLWSVTLIEAAKVASIAAAVGLASVGAYYFYSNPILDKGKEVARTEQQTLNNIPHNSIADKEPIKPSPSANEINSAKDFNSNPDNANAPLISNNRPKPFTPEIKKANDKFKPVVSISEYRAVSEVMEATEPNVTIINPKNANDISLPEDGISNKSVLETVNPEVIIKKENRDKFHYQFSDSKLILYADFSDKIYEILELNQNNTKSMFLAYDNKFFALDASMFDITPLKELNDSQLVQILRSYQLKKN